jgi:DHA1 family multidrug resistance protein-like MFS transporter
MQEEDYEILRNRADANPAEYSQWDPQRQFRSEYAELHRNDPTMESAGRGPNRKLRGIQWNRRLHQRP